MASVRTSSLVADIRGSVSTVTYARNSAGLYVRNRTSPAQPPSAKRDDCQEAIEYLSQYWSLFLDQQTRDAWNTWSAIWPRPNRWGLPQNPSGYLEYMRTNFDYWRNFHDLGYMTPPQQCPYYKPEFTVTAEASGNTFTINIPIPNYSVWPSNLIFYIYAGRPRNAGVTFHRSPYTYVDYLFWDGTWTPDPATFAHPYPLAMGKRCWFKMSVQDWDSGNRSSTSAAQCSVASAALSLPVPPPQPGGAPAQPFRQPGKRPLPPRRPPAGTNLAPSLAPAIEGGT